MVGTSAMQGMALFLLDVFEGKDVNNAILNETETFLESLEFATEKDLEIISESIKEDYKEGFSEGAFTFTKEDVEKKLEEFICHSDVKDFILNIFTELEAV